MDEFEIQWEGRRLKITLYRAIYAMLPDPKGGFQYVLTGREKLSELPDGLDLSIITKRARGLGCLQYRGDVDRYDPQGGRTIRSPAKAEITIALSKEADRLDKFPAGEWVPVQWW